VGRGMRRHMRERPEIGLILRKVRPRCRTRRMQTFTASSSATAGGQVRALSYPNPTPVPAGGALLACQAPARAWLHALCALVWL